jgi:hypothetical protein
MDFEKRNSPRYPTITEMSFEHLGHNAQGRLTDISLGGFFVDTMNPLPAGAVIGFRFDLSGNGSEIPIRGEGRVVWQRPMQGMGVRFTWVSVVDQNRLMSFLSQKLAV